MSVLFSSCLLRPSSRWTILTHNPEEVLFLPLDFSCRPLSLPEFPVLFFRLSFLLSRFFTAPATIFLRVYSQLFSSVIFWPYVDCPRPCLHVWGFSSQKTSLGNLLLLTWKPRAPEFFSSMIFPHCTSHTPLTDRRFFVLPFFRLFFLFSPYVLSTFSPCLSMGYFFLGSSLLPHPPAFG